MGGLFASFALFAEFPKFSLESLIFFPQGIELAFGVAAFGTREFLGLHLQHEFLFGVYEFSFHVFGTLGEFVGQVVHFGSFEVFRGGANMPDAAGEDLETFSLGAEFGWNFGEAGSRAFKELFNFGNLGFDVLEAFVVAVGFCVAGLSEEVCESFFEMWRDTWFFVLRLFGRFRF